jgi:hypothetical protein
LGFSYFPVENDQVDSFTKFNFSPNPANDKIKIEWLAATSGEIIIYDMNGHIQYFENIIGLKYRWVDISQLPNANYFITFKNNEGLISSKRLVIIK